jgi:peptidoglycan/LPS O-acetylase OafA/YrhL
VIATRGHIRSLDGLRGIAILLVFLYHYFPRDLRDPLSPVASLGWSGVDLFLVLSGFLITGILIDTRDSPNRFKSFYTRRALRLLPVYFLAVAVVLAGTHFLRGYRTWSDIPFFLYASNITQGLPNTYSIFPPYFNCRHFWTLALEEQFYSIWPFIVFFVPSRKTLSRICVAGILLAVSLRVFIVASNGSRWMANLELPTRMDSLLIGALLAILVRSPEPEKWLNPVRLRWFLVAACGVLAILLASARSLFWETTPMCTVGYTVLALIYAGVLAYALIPGTFLERVGSLRVLRFFGRISYGFYVWHNLPNPLVATWLDPFRRWIHPRFAADLLYTICMLGLFTAISVVSYSQFEVRFLRLKSKFTAIPTAGVVVAPATSDASMPV